MNNLTQQLLSSIKIQRLKSKKKELIKQAQILQTLIELEERKVIEEHEVEIEHATI